MCIYTMSIHMLYLVSDLEDSDNGDPLRDYSLQLAVIHGLVTVGTPGLMELFQV